MRLSPYNKKWKKGPYIQQTHLILLIGGLALLQFSLHGALDSVAPSGQILNFVVPYIIISKVSTPPEVEFLDSAQLLRPGGVNST